MCVRVQKCLWPLTFLTTPRWLHSWWWYWWILYANSVILHQETQRLLYHELYDSVAFVLTCMYVMTWPPFASLLSLFSAVFIPTLAAECTFSVVVVVVVVSDGADILLISLCVNFANFNVETPVLSFNSFSQLPVNKWLVGELVVWDVTFNLDPRISRSLQLARGTLCIFYSLVLSFFLPSHCLRVI